MITSTRNPKLQLARSLLGRPVERREAGLFVAEGVRLVEEAQVAGWPAELVLYAANLNPRGLAVVARFSESGIPVEAVAPEILAAASDTRSPQGLLAVLRMQSLPLPERLDLAFIPAGVRDPGNLGTMLRTAAAAAVGAVFLPVGTTDPYAPKVVRAAMGAHFRLPVHLATWEEIAGRLSTASLQVYLAAAGEGIPYTEAGFRSPAALIVGGEAEGAGAEAARLAHARVHIPMPGGIESLNAAVAAGILLFEALRQRSNCV